MSRPALVGLPRTEIERLFESAEAPALRAKQVAEWIYRKAALDFGEMTTLPKAERDRLSRECQVTSLRIVREQRSRDGVVKLLLDGGDAQAFEAVLLPFSDRVSCCLSSQVGCPMGCTFCATGLSGFDRNLTRGEIVSQYLMLQRKSDRRISHVVFMGMGEPLLNYDEVLAAIRLLHDEVGLSYRHITISTVGVVPGILRLAEEGLPLHLALSLHSPLDAVRSRLIPANRRWDVAEVFEAVETYFAKTKRKITIEYLLIDRVTDTEEQARALVPLTRRFPCVVNLIPFNAVENPYGFRRPSRNRIRAFRAWLEGAGVNVTQRVERGHDIAAACGQLKGLHEGKFAKRRESSLPIAPS